MGKKHNNRQKEVMLEAQRLYSGIRLWETDNGHAYALFSVTSALQEYKRTGSITAAKRKLVRIVYGRKGFPDLVGIYQGIFIGIEIKVGQDRQRKEQKTMESAIRKAGGIYILLDDKSEIHKQLKPLEAIKKWAEEIRK